MEMGWEESDFTLEKLGKYYFNQVIKVNGKSN